MLLERKCIFALAVIAACLAGCVSASAQQRRISTAPAPQVKTAQAKAEQAKTRQVTQPAGISLRTNLLWDGVAEPNLGIEIALGKHVSLGMNAGIKTWPRWLAWDTDNVENPTHWRNFAIVPEFRYYPRQTYDGFFLGADLLYTHFNVGHIGLPLIYQELREHRLQGDFYGGGLFAGYSFWLGSHWRLELEAGAAVGLAQYGRYNCSFCGNKLDDVSRVGIVPKLGLNIAWNPKARPNKKRK